MITLECNKYSQSMNRHQATLSTVEEKFSKAFSACVEDTAIDCMIDSWGNPIVMSAEQGKLKNQQTLETLLESIPFLKKKEHHLLLAKIINFCLSGNRFTVIENPKKYIETYHRHVENEKDLFELPLCSVSQNGIFKVDEIDQPSIKEDLFIFYVSEKIPYRVSIKYPITQEGEFAKYELLPFC